MILHPVKHTRSFIYFPNDYTFIGNKTRRDILGHQMQFPAITVNHIM